MINSSCHAVFSAKMPCLLKALDLTQASLPSTTSKQKLLPQRSGLNSVRLQNPAFKELEGTMNIAILVGISNYASEHQLPACALDAENMRRLLLATRKYDDVQLVSDQTTASQVKDALRNFFAKHQNSGSIDEALIYFSGHGVYQNDALLCCTDFDANRPATTSISNSELDDLLRSVKPNVAVKIIDACQSGSPYIKDASAGFEKALGKSQLNSFICMASSRQDQSSYASRTESFFTARWIQAALSKPEGHILYRDIQAALADAFVASPDQTPFFINQGTGLEAFSSVTDEMRALQVSRSKSVEPEKPESAIAQLIEIHVKELDRQFVPHAQVLRATEASKASLITEGVSDLIVAQFYQKSVKSDGKLNSIPKSRAVASFAEEQAWPKRYFVRVNQEPYSARTLKDPFAAIGLSGLKFLSKHGDDDYVTETKYRAGSLETTEPLPIEVAELSFTSGHPSLTAFVIYVGVVHSLTEVMVLSSTAQLSQKGWDARAPELTNLQWRYQSYPWSEVVQEPTILWREAQSRGESEIRAYLESLAPRATASIEDADTKDLSH